MLPLILPLNQENLTEQIEAVRTCIAAAKTFTISINGIEKIARTPITGTDDEKQSIRANLYERVDKIFANLTGDEDITFCFDYGKSPNNQKVRLKNNAGGVQGLGNITDYNQMLKAEVEKVKLTNQMERWKEKYEDNIKQLEELKENAKKQEEKILEFKEREESNSILNIAKENPEIVSGLLGTAMQFFSKGATAGLAGTGATEVVEKVVEKNIEVNTTKKWLEEGLTEEQIVKLYHCIDVLKNHTEQLDSVYHFFTTPEKREQEQE